jgi:hypothetical protein
MGVNSHPHKFGLQNPGSDVVINDIMPRLDKTETRFIINISVIPCLSVILTEETGVPGENDTLVASQ